MPTKNTIRPAEHRHNEYVVGGRRVPSVTEILSKVIAKPFLTRWANNLGLGGVSLADESRHTLGIGTLVHANIEGILNGMGVDSAGFTEVQISTAGNCAIEFARWAEGKDISVLATEKQMVSASQMYGGTIDAYLEVDGVPTLMDWKTSKIISTDYYIQLAAYAALLEENGEKPQAAAVLRLPKDGGRYEYSRMAIGELKGRYSKAWALCLALYAELGAIA